MQMVPEYNYQRYVHCIIYLISGADYDNENSEKAKIYLLLQIDDDRQEREKKT